MPMPYESLRAFIAAVQAGSFSGAARLMGVSQPWISQRIAQLEVYLGRRRRQERVQLFERGRRGIVLTPEGRILRDLAVDPLRSLDQLEDAFESRRGTGAGRLVIATGSTSLLYLVPEAIRKFRKAHPQVRIETLSGNTADLWRRVLNDEVDFGLGDPGDSNVDTAGVRMEMIRAVDRVLVAAAGDPILRRTPPLHAADLRDRDWIVLPQQGVTRRKLDDVLGSYSIAMVVDQYEVAKVYTALGVGVAMMPELAVGTEDRKRLGTIALGKEFGRSYFSILVREKKVLSPAATALIEAIRPPAAVRPAKRDG
jgi:DNA-binding transcriptional LysR family regulator